MFAGFGFEISSFCLAVKRSGLGEARETFFQVIYSCVIMTSLSLSFSFLLILLVSESFLAGGSLSGMLFSSQFVFFNSGAFLLKLCVRGSYQN